MVPEIKPRVVGVSPELGELGSIHIYGDAGGKPKPFVLGIHGGAWRNGDQSSFGWLWPRLRHLGVSLVLPSYRKAPEFPFPAAYDDLIRVCLWLARHGDCHGLDPGRSVLFGSSAGAHLAMMLATRGMGENIGMPDFRGVAAYCGAYDLLAQHEFDAANAATMTPNFLGAMPVENPAMYRLASPQFHVHARTPPVWMAHGGGDKVVLVSQSRLMGDALRRGGHDPIYHEARNVPHTMCESDPDGNLIDPQTLLFEPDLLRFIKRAIADAPPEIGGGDAPEPRRG